MMKKALKHRSATGVSSEPAPIQQYIKDEGQLLLAKMQTPGARRGAQKAFALPPEELGAIAVKAAKATAASK